MNETMFQSMKKYGLPPLGPSRRLWFEVMKGAYRSCSRCAGSGYLPGVRRQRYRECPDCHGLGGILAISVEEFIVRREQIVARGGSVLSCTVYDPVTGEAHHLEGRHAGVVDPPVTPEEEDEQGSGFLVLRGGPDLTARDLFEAAQRLLPRAERRTWAEEGDREGPGTEHRD
ncbi:MAG TPA: hypothetical protein PKO09_10750 [Anaerolineae bacterium]|nr:hypothetical protein [Anaerolineae bacterium]